MKFRVRKESIVTKQSKFPNYCCQDMKAFSAQLVGELIVPGMPIDGVVEIDVRSEREEESYVSSFSQNRLDDAETAFNCLHFLSHIADCTVLTLFMEFGQGLEPCCINPLFNPLIVHRLREWRE